MIWVFRIPAWLLFLLMLVLVFVGQTLSFVLSTLPLALLIFGWVWSIGVECNRRLPPELRKSPALFTFGYVFALLYSFVAPGYFLNPPLPALIMVAHFASLVFIFYGLWFSASQFMTLRRKERVSAVDVLGPFFGMWFFPIGVWFIQPRLNRLVIECSKKELVPVCSDS